MGLVAWDVFILLSQDWVIIFIFLKLRAMREYMIYCDESLSKGTYHSHFYGGQKQWFLSGESGAEWNKKGIEPVWGNQVDEGECSLSGEVQADDGCVLFFHNAKRLSSNLGTLPRFTHTSTLSSSVWTLFWARSLSHMKMHLACPEGGSGAPGKKTPAKEELFQYIWNLIKVANADPEYDI